jgi:ankyrin repeat protein/energy-coupling factor transporter ATP-binding protein EcfA2
MTYRRLEADQAFQNTCTWILQHPSYLAWISKGQELLWLKGKPGSGKSTLLAFICRAYIQRVRPASVIHLDFFFHGRGAPLQKTAEGMFRSLLHQVFMQCPLVRLPVHVAFEKRNQASGEHGKNWEWHPQELKTLFFDALLRAAQSHAITIFVDALDEAGAQVASELTSYFHRLKDEIATRNGDVRICISCRHYPVIPKSPSLEIHVEDENKEDISTYVFGMLIPEGAETDARTNLKNEWRSLAEDVIDKSSGVFQWAKLVVPLITKLRLEGESLSYIKQRLAEVPKSLEEVYAHILENIIDARNRPRTLLMMQWICLAVRPLSVTELRFAMASDCLESHQSLHSSYKADVLIEDDRHMKKLITTLSGGLAEVTCNQSENWSGNYEIRTTVQFIHQSVNDFLISSGLRNLASNSSWDLPTRDSGLCLDALNRNILSHSQQRLSRSCVNYLKLQEVVEFIPNEIHLAGFRTLCSQRIQQRFPFVKYATNSCFFHAQKAESLDVVQQDPVQRLSPKCRDGFAYWIKIYRLVNEFHHARPVAGSTLLHIASRLNLLGTVQALLEKGVPINEKDDRGNTALNYAAGWGHQDLVKTLLKSNAEVNTKNGENFTALLTAAANGHVGIVKLLMHHGASIHIQDRMSPSALHVASATGSKRLVRMFLEAGADVNAQGGSCGNALMEASRAGHDIIVQELLVAGADVNAQGGRYGNALQVASYVGDDIIVQQLLEAGADVNAQGGEYGNALQAASYGGHDIIVQRLLEAKADVNAQSGYFGNALQAASCAGHDVIVQRLLEAGADVNARGGEYKTALRAAFKKNHKVIGQRLLKARTTMTPS